MRYLTVNKYNGGRESHTFITSNSYEKVKFYFTFSFTNYIFKYFIIRYFYNKQ